MRDEVSPRRRIRSDHPVEDFAVGGLSIRWRALRRQGLGPSRITGSVRDAHAKGSIREQVSEDGTIGVRKC